MKNYGDYELADLLIHELLHATVFVKGQVQFNEQLAEFVGSTGARLYIENRFGKESAEYSEIGEKAAKQKESAAKIRMLCGELEKVYADAALSSEEKIVRKKEIAAAAQERYELSYEVPANNAWFDLFRLYYEEDNFFADLYAGLPGEEPSAEKLRTFVGAASALNKNSAAKKNPRGELEKILGSLSAQAGSWPRGN
jgi:predicted aminopeptidase